MLGMKMSLKEFSFSPVKNTEFSVKGVQLAGTEFDISVKKNWSKCFINGVEAEPAFAREAKKVTLEFI